MLKQRRCTFRIPREATEIQLLTNLAFKITEFRAELPISCFTARSRANRATQIWLLLAEKSISLPITAS